MSWTTGGLPPAVHLVALDAVGSTNDEAFRLGREGAPEITLVTARCQESGRGRRGRTWSSPEGNLYASFLLRPPLPLARLPELSFVAAVAAGEACGSLLPAGRRIELKWPNDVLIEGAKLAGILTETEAAPGGGHLVAVGIGINVASAPPHAAYPVTGLSDHATVTVGMVRDRLSDRLAHWYAIWLAEGFRPVHAAWSLAALPRGRALAVRIGQETIEGGFAGIDEAGALLLDLPAGDRRRILAGDVMLQA